MSHFSGVTLAGIATVALTACAATPSPKAKPDPESVQQAQLKQFLQTTCYECHDEDMSEGDLDLTPLVFDPADEKNQKLWTEIYDRVKRGQMPPPEESDPVDPQALAAFQQTLFGALSKNDRAKVDRQGRATRRRLNRHEYENNVRDLLALPWLEIKDFLPEDTEAHGFNKVGDALDISHVHMARYLQAAEHALRAAIAPQAERPRKETKRYHTWDQPNFRIPWWKRTIRTLGHNIQPWPASWREPGFARRDRAKNMDIEQVDLRDRRRMPAHLAFPRDPKQLDNEATIVTTSTYEPIEIRFNRFHAPLSGRYNLRLAGYSVWLDRERLFASKGRRPEPITVYSDTAPSNLRRLGGFDFGADKTVGELRDIYLLQGETIRPDAARLVRSRPPDHRNPFLTDDGMPGVAFQWLEIEGPIFETWPPAGHQLLFGDLPMRDKPPRKVTYAREGRGELKIYEMADGVEVISDKPKVDAERLLRRFMAQAYGQKPHEEDAQALLGIIAEALDNGMSFTDAMVTGYTAVLASPQFIFLDEKAGALSQDAVANRMSYFLWNSRPDNALMKAAADGALKDKTTRRKHAERMLNDARAERFINAFSDYWLDLRMLGESTPDKRLYPEYDLDDWLTESVRQEPRLYLSELIEQNRGIANLIDSDFTYLNERLASHYGIKGVRGTAMRRVTLPKDSVRGGLLTQAGVMKVTANGTTTSPVVRGVWVMDRILGTPPPPPPENVDGLDPDTRGATTIRKQLEKHRESITCNRCHRLIDPAGLALESFDVMGGYRERYRSLEEGDKARGIAHNGQRFRYRIGLPVEPHGEFEDGRSFANILEFKQRLLEDQRQLARNFVERLVVYATGAPVRFSDRSDIEAILDKRETSGFGMRDLVFDVIESRLFDNK